MAQEKKRVMGELAAWHLAGVAAVMPLVNARLNPQSINPYRRASKMARKLAEVRAFISSAGLAAMVHEAIKGKDKG